MNKDQAKTVRKGEELDKQKLQHYLRQFFDQPQGELQVKQFPSGFSNLTYLITFGDQEAVLRRPPLWSQHQVGPRHGKGI